MVFAWAECADTRVTCNKVRSLCDCGCVLPLCCVWICMSMLAYVCVHVCVSVRACAVYACVFVFGC